MTDFTTADSNLVANGHGTLTGATVTLGDAEIQGAGTANPADISSATTVLTPGVQSATILGATAGHGSGNSLLDFGGKMELQKTQPSNFLFQQVWQVQPSIQRI